MRLVKKVALDRFLGAPRLESSYLKTGVERGVATVAVLLAWLG